VREQTLNTCSTHVPIVLEQNGNPSMKTEDGRLKEKTNHLSVVPSSLSPHCQTPTSLLTRLQHLETAQIEDAISIRAASRRMETRESEIQQLATALFGGGS
jgi:hypothetical protein